jgi:hypothetical protein
MSESDPLAEQRAFYDDTDYSEVQLEPAEDVQVVHRPAPRSTFAVRLDGETIEQLRQVAQRKGTRPTQLVRDWVVERLASEQHEQAGPRQPVEIRRLEVRVGDLEARLNDYVGGGHVQGTAKARGADVDS